MQLPKGGTSWTPGAVERPGLTPIKPAAEYDPKMAESLAAQTKYSSELEQGSGRNMDVLTQAQADQCESQVAQARASAAQAGIPFNEPQFRMSCQKNINAAMATEKTTREAQLGQALGQQAATAGAQAGERTQRLGVDLQAQQASAQDLLSRYGIDVSKYGIDAQAATSANNALLSFDSQLMGGMFSMMGQGVSMSSQNYYG